MKEIEVKIKLGEHTIEIKAKNEDFVNRILQDFFNGVANVEVKR